eukprot:g12743.t1
MCAGAASSTVMQFFTVPLDIIGQRMMVDGPRGPAGAGAGAHAPPNQPPGPSGSRTAAAGEGGGRDRVTGGGGGAGMGDGGRTNVTAREVARQVYGESGLRGFYRGFGVSVLQFAPTSAVWWAAYGVYSRAFVRALGNLPAPLPPLSPEQRQVGGQAAAGFCTGMTTVVLTNPLDVLRTRLQVEGRRGDDRTLISEYRILIAESGPMGLMRGLGPRILAMAPASVLIVSVYELIKRLSRKTPVAPLPPPPPSSSSKTTTTAATIAVADVDNRC